ncbi:pilus assembly protein TadG-related protein [Fundidesulfovibrio agrisoli]|uniref:pilus assembly protein TadG-related protein n=1 Tax=Fundidesulfovibrio agrisoli TaxID=2922717 RepID=UPI001FABDDB3|nr:pilus assembly protein TadG-related protein [Fundidesulfovibrio agrisoli]
MQKAKFRNESGSVSVLVAISLIVLAGFGAFAVDLGYLKLKRGQLQAAVDAAAMAGAVKLVGYGTVTNKVRSDVASEALEFGHENIKAADNPAAAMQINDVVIDTNGLGFVEVTAGLTAQRGNPVRLFLAQIVNKNQADVTATARASIYCIKSTNCLKPWAVYRPTSFTNADVGTSVTVYTDAGITSNWHGSIRLGSSSGAKDYYNNIITCVNEAYSQGDVIRTEPGKMKQDNKRGFDYLFNQDSDAKWDSATKSIVGSNPKFGDPSNSPRVVTVVLTKTINGNGQSVVVDQLGTVFLETVDGNGTVTGRLVNAFSTGPRDDSGKQCGTLHGVSLTADSTRGAN